MKNMFELLKPQYFDLFVSAGKNVAKYDHKKNIYDAST